MTGVLVERDKEALHQAIADYAQANAGTPADLDPNVEDAAVSHLLNGISAPPPSFPRKRESRGGDGGFTRPA